MPQKKERRGGELVHGQAGLDAGADILQTVGQGVAQFDVGGGAGLLHVVAGDGDGVELGHIGGGIAEDVADDPHGGLRGIDIGVADHELLEDVVLNGAGEELLVHTLLLGGQDIEGHDGQHGAVHGHGHGHLVQRDAGEEDLHIQDGVHGHAGLAHVAHHTGVVGVIAAVGGQVEGNGQTLLTGRQIAAVEGVGLLGSGEAGVLPDGPGPGDVHGGVGPAKERGHAGHEVQVVHTLQVFGGVDGSDIDLLHGMRDEFFQAFAGLFFDLRLPGGLSGGAVLAAVTECHGGKIRLLVHHSTPFVLWILLRIS